LQCQSNKARDVWSRDASLLQRALGQAKTGKWLMSLVASAREVAARLVCGPCSLPVAGLVTLRAASCSCVELSMVPQKTKTHETEQQLRQWPSIHCECRPRHHTFRNREQKIDTIKALQIDYIFAGISSLRAIQQIHSAIVHSL
jgi:hypothetical protein